jgi:hypothetical protein
MLSIPFGQPYQLGQNTSNCRNIHQNMVPLRPAVHCPHIGPYSICPNKLIAGRAERIVFLVTTSKSQPKNTSSHLLQILLVIAHLLVYNY